jgi:hypothetical protein
VDGRVTSGTAALPGVSIVAQVGDSVKATTSTDLDGKYTIAFSPDATYHISADFTGFTRAERDVTLASPPCATTADFVLVLKPRRDPLTTAAPADSAALNRARDRPRRKRRPGLPLRTCRRRAGRVLGRRRRASGFKP